MRTDGVLDNYALTRELTRLKKAFDAQTLSMKNLQKKYKKLKNIVHFLLPQQSKPKRRRLRKLSSFTLGRKQDVNLNEDVIKDADIILKKQTTVEEKTADQSTGVDQNADQSTDVFNDDVIES